MRVCDGGATERERKFLDELEEANQHTDPTSINQLTSIHW
jgi:hypothetical protein